jgi:hypothetical protein
MGARDAAVPRGTFVAALRGAFALALAGGLGCASAGGGEAASRPAPAPTPVPAVAPQTVTPAAPAPPAPGTVEPEAVAPRDDHEIVIDAGGSRSAAPTTLAGAARAERQRRATADRPMLTIDDKNLAQHATGGLTIASAAPAEEGAAAASDAPDEQRWRQRVRTLREHWALAVDSIDELEQRVASLRTRFYAADDPYVRDGQIKPAWDHALENLAASRIRARELELELQATLEEGRRAGALPGWLREGLELEPTEFPYERPEQTEPVEGEIVGEPVVIDGSGEPQ